MTTTIIHISIHNFFSCKPYTSNLLGN